MEKYVSQWLKDVFVKEEHAQSVMNVVKHIIDVNEIISVEFVKDNPNVCFIQTEDSEKIVELFDVDVNEDVEVTLRSATMNGTTTEIKHTCFKAPIELIK